MEFGILGSRGGGKEGAIWELESFDFALRALKLKLKLIPSF